MVVLVASTGYVFGLSGFVFEDLEYYVFGSFGLIHWLLIHFSVGDLGPFLLSVCWCKVVFLLSWNFLYRLLNYLPVLLQCCYLRAD